MNKIFFIGMLSIILGTYGCQEIAIPVTIYSNPSGGKVEINGLYQGETPLKITLNAKKNWVGLLNASGGWAYANSVVVVTVFPPSNSNQQLFSQTKSFRMNETTFNEFNNEMFFDLTLQQINPKNSVQIDHNVNIKTDNITDKISEQLFNLKTLKDKELISEEEYISKKKEILQSLNSR